MKKQALIKFLNLNEEEQEDIIETSYNENIFEYHHEEYEVFTDEEADEKWEKELQFYIDEIILPKIPEPYQKYFDEEKWKTNARLDGRGYAISKHDGYEYEITIDGKTFYIYRQN